MSRLKTAQELFRRNRMPGDLVFAVAFFVFALFLVFNLGDQVTWHPKTKLVAQPAFWPTISVIGMAIFAALHLLGSVCSPRIPGRWIEVWVWFRALEFGGWFMAYVLLLPWVGYLLASLIFATSLTYRLGYRGLKPQGFAALLAFVTVILFRGLLHVSVPAGFIYQYLPGSLRSIAQIYF